MKTIKPRAKSKKSNARFGRVKFSNKESVEAAGPDLSQLRKPVDISLSSLLEVTRLLEIGGEEVKSMLAYECDVVYECRVCRSLFRSLANFISHKRVYCREEFNVALYRKTRSDRIIPAETYIPERIASEDVNCKEDDNNIRILRSQVVRKSSKKDLTSVVDMLQRKRSEDINENLIESGHAIGISNSKPASEILLGIEDDKANPQILLEEIDSTKTAVYQTAAPPTSSMVDNTDLMKAQIIELQNMADQNTAILNSDGRSIDARELEKSDSPLQIYGSDDEDGSNADLLCARDLVCSVCNAKFATRKTLTYHMKSLHVSYRTCYPCPCCNSTFANTWSVYRHLFKLHRKTNEQVRKLRTQIQEKAFRKETTGAEDIEKENALIKSSSTPETQTSNDTQEWMEHFELDLEFQRCGGCGRRFDRRAALISHSQLCQKRIAACNEAALGGGRGSKRLSKTPSPNNVAEENSRLPKETIKDRAVLTRAQSSRKKVPRKSKEQQGGAESPSVESHPNTSSEENLPESTSNSELSIRVENVSRISAADWEMMGSNSSSGPSSENSSPVSDIIIEKEQSSIRDDKSMSMSVPDSPEIIFTSIDEARTVAISFGAKKRRVSLINNSKELANGSGNNENSVKVSTGIDREVISPDHITVMENRIATIANLRKLQCLPCRKKFTSMTNLRRHMAVHIGWHRYKCKLCDFKCFVKCDCVAHCNKVHDAQNNRSVIADMVVQIPPDESILAKEIMMDIAKAYPAKNSEPELIDVTDSSPKSIEIGEKSGEDSMEITDEGGSESKKADRECERPRDEETPEEKKDGKDSDGEEKSDKTQGRLDQDPDLRKMVMEVIFGTAEEGSTSGKASEGSSRSSGVDVTAGSEGETSPEKASELKGTTIVSENMKSRTSFSAGNKLEDMKRQRPTRNRVKPVNEDFIYDLTELIRKESAIHRASAVAAQKTFKKKQQQAQQQQQQGITENDGSESGGAKDAKSVESESNEIPKLSPVCKLPNILSHKKGEFNGYNGKLSSLRQVEVRLDPTHCFPSGKNAGSTKISVSNEK